MWKKEMRVRRMRSPHSLIRIHVHVQVHASMYTIHADGAYSCMLIDVD